MKHLASVFDVLHDKAEWVHPHGSTPTSYLHLGWTKENGD